MSKRARHLIAFAILLLLGLSSLIDGIWPGWLGYSPWNRWVSLFAGGLFTLTAVVGLVRLVAPDKPTEREQ